MPLTQGKSKKAFKHNIEAEMHAGKPQDQALAIAYNVKRKNKAKGGMVMDDARDMRMSRLKEDLFGHGGEVSGPEHGMAEGEMEDMDKDNELFLSAEGDGEMGDLAEGGEVVPMDVKRKNRLRGILSEIPIKRAR